MRFPDERSWHSVTKIYLILKISEELEALILSTEAPCHTPFSTRPAGNSPAAPLSQRPSHAALLCVRHFIPDGCAWCHRLFNCTCCRDILSTAWLLPPRLWHLARQRGAAAATSQDRTRLCRGADRTAACTALPLGEAVLPSTSHLPIHSLSP